ncbi:MAG TPA: nitroreductase/quinone reductase family protein [Candidatus Dormibacteraeota bacterium]|nr:nitroreductase/quinone reductase family protein [Candidatus Dormibacteraeota bacterium]
MSQIPADMKSFNQKLIADFRANKGRLSGPMAGRKLMLLTTKGARTGQDRTVVLGYRQAGDSFVVIASANGAPSDPAWYRNLQAHPHATAEVGDKKYHVHPRTTEGEERERMGALVDYLPGEEKKTSRKIPVVVLEPGK